MRRGGQIVGGALLASLALVQTAAAEDVDWSNFDFSGYVSAETRIFPESPKFQDQKDTYFSPSTAVQPELRYRWNGRDDRVTFVPFARVDADDRARTHVDVRELNWYHAGEDWDMVLGISKVFWGVTESRHLVDIINQTDLVESPDEEEKLGQPMVNFNLMRDWGTLSFFVLPGFRERTFPSDNARLRGAMPVDKQGTTYDSDAEQWHVDFAVRYSHSIENWDFGIAHFYGTSREPRLIPGLNNSGEMVLRPHYDIINQTSLDAQYTIDSWLLKLEAITRFGQGDPFFAAVGGFEYTFFDVSGSDIDLGLLAEYLHDGRDDKAPQTPFDDDIFIGTRLTLNDVENTSLLAGVILDIENNERIFSLEFERRLTDNLNLEVEGQFYNDINSGDTLSGFARDSYIEMRMSWFF